MTWVSSSITEAMQRILKNLCRLPIRTRKMRSKSKDSKTMTSVRMKRISMMMALKRMTAMKMNCPT